MIQLLKDGDGSPFAAIARDDLKAEPSLNKFVNSLTSFPRPRAVAATDYALTNNSTSFKVKVPGPGVVVLTESYVPQDFQLRVNGRPEHYFRVNSAFKGIFVPRAGDYIISFLYWPRFFTFLLWMAGVAIVVLVSWLVVLSMSSVASSGVRLSSRDVAIMQSADEQK